MLKKDELNSPISCLNKAGPDEPLFVLRAKDRLAPAVVRHWAEISRWLGAHEEEKTDEAFALANAMIEWRRANGLPKELP